METGLVLLKLPANRSLCFNGDCCKEVSEGTQTGLLLLKMDIHINVFL